MRVTKTFRVAVRSNKEFVTIFVDAETASASDQARRRSLDLMFAEARRLLEAEIARERAR
jgi:hypothetical protein